MLHHVELVGMRDEVAKDAIHAITMYTGAVGVLAGIRAKVQVEQGTGSLLSCLMLDGGSDVGVEVWNRKLGSCRGEETIWACSVHHVSS